MLKGAASVTSQGSPALLKNLLAQLGNINVCVGIPEEEASRGGGKETINNAELAYIHSHGIRRESMRNEMQGDVDLGKPYSRAYELYVHEHGSPLWNSPPRPIIEPAIAKHSEEIADKLKPAILAKLSGDNQGARDEVEKAGMLAADKVKEYFTEDNGWPENSERTIKRKGSDRVLIDTGALRQSITYVVEDGG